MRLVHDKKAEENLPERVLKMGFVRTETLLFTSRNGRFEMHVSGLPDGDKTDRGTQKGYILNV